MKTERRDRYSVILRLTEEKDTDKVDTEIDIKRYSGIKTDILIYC